MDKYFEIVREYANEYSMDVFLFIAGSFGALLSKDDKQASLSKKQRVLRVASGGVVAVFLTQLVVEVSNYLFGIILSQRASGAVGFFLGHIGMVGVTRLMIVYSERKKK